MIYSDTAASKAVNTFIAVILIFLSFLCLAPIIHVLSLSISEPALVNAGKIDFLPKEITFGSYKKIMDDGRFYTAFGVSVKRVILGALVNFLLTLLMAFPLSRDTKQFKSRNMYMWLLIFTMMFNAGLIPNYMTIKSLGLIDSIWALVLPGAVPVFNVILLVNFFRNLPKELDEAAYIDGASPMYILLYVYIPLAIPAIATVTLFSIVGHWNSFFDGLIYMNNPNNYPLQTYISQIVITFDPNLTIDYETMKERAMLSDRTLSAAKIFISMIPILIIYPFLQRYFVKGITLGSVKE